MEADRFSAIVENKGSQLRALMSPLIGARGGRVAFYNAYFNGTEVVVAGYQFDDRDGHTYTKPVAILVDEEVFDRLRVDDEAGRIDASGGEAPGRVL